MANEFKVKKGLIIDGSNTVVDVQGTQGQLFSVTDSLTGDLFSVSDVSGIPIFNVNSSGLSTFDGDVTINGGDITIVKQNDAPTMTLLHDGTNPSTNDLLFKMQFQSDYNGDHQNWGKIELDTNASSVRTNMDFYVKSASGAEQLALRLEGQPSAVPNATFAGDVATGGEFQLNSGAQIDWANGDARIVEGDTNNYSLSFQTFDGSSCSTALRLDGDNTATFSGDVTVTGGQVYLGGTTYAIENVGGNYGVRNANGDYGGSDGTNAYTTPQDFFHIPGSLRVGPKYATSDRDYIKLIPAGSTSTIEMPNENAYIHNNAGNIVLRTGSSTDAVTVSGANTTFGGKITLPNNKAAEWPGGSIRAEGNILKLVATDYINPQDIVSITAGGSSSPTGVEGLHLMYDTNHAYIKAENNGTTNRPLTFTSSAYTFSAGNATFAGSITSQAIKVDQTGSDAGLHIGRSDMTSSNFATTNNAIFFADELPAGSYRHQASISAVREAWSNSPTSLVFKTSATVNGATTALTLNSSQEAIFAGNVAANTGTSHSFLTGNTNNTSSADTVGFRLHQSSYTDGKYTHRFRKFDKGGGVPLYIDQSAGTANVFENLMRIGGFSGEVHTVEVNGSFKSTFTNTTGYQIAGTYIVDSSRNLVNINNATASQLTIDDYIYHAGDSNTYIYFTDDKQTFRTGGGDRFIIDNNGSTFSGHVKLFNTDEQIPNQNLLDIGSIKIAGRNDIYANATKTTYGDYVAKYVNDGTGGTTIRLYVDTGVLVDNEPYMVSVYYENLIGTLTLDWCDTNIIGTNDVTGTSSSPKSGRVFGYGTRSTYGSTYRFLDINLSNGSGNEVTLHSPKVEAGYVVTDFVSTERTDMTSNSKHVKDLKVTHDAIFEQGVDINYGGSDRLSITGDVNVQGSTDLTIPQTRKLLFDGAGGHTYISETADSNLKVYVAATEVANFTNDFTQFSQYIKLVRTPGANNTNPTLAFGDGNTGFYERSDNDLRVTVGGVNYWEFSANCMGNVNEGKAHFNSETATATNPSVIPWRNDSDTGIGRASADNLSLIAGGTETLRLGSNLATFNVGNSGATVFDVQGSNGQLFSVTDSLTGDLFSVSDVSGVPILNVNSSGAVDIDGTLNVKSDITMDNSGSGDTTLSISTTTGGDPTLIFNSDAANRNGLIRFQDNGTNIGRIQYVHNGDKLEFQAGSGTGYALQLTNTAAKIDANLYLENVDTNTSSETTVLVLNGSTNEVEKRDLGSLAFSGLGDSASGNRWGVNAFVAGDGVMEVGKYIDFHTSDGSTADHALRITANGTTAAFSAGITASSATFSSTVDMNATARFNFSANSHGSQFEAASAAQQTFRCDSDKFRIYMGSERFNVTNTGRVGINKATPAYTLDVNGSVSNISIYASHDVAAYSDARVKTDIQTIPNALDKVNKLRGVTFKRTDEGSTDKRMMGVIAQEVLDVIPEVVNQRESDGHYSVSYSNMVGVLIEAVKELKAEVEELKKQIK